VTENIHVRETDRKSLDHITLKDGDEPAVTLRDRKRFFTEAIERARCADLSEADRHELVKHIRDRVSSIYYPPPFTLTCPRVLSFRSSMRSRSRHHRRLRNRTLVHGGRMGDD